MGAITRLWRGDGVEVVRVRAPGGRLAYDRHFHDDWVIGVNLTGREHLWLDHRDHDAESRHKLQRTAHRLGLMVTGGSDYHGTGKRNVIGENRTCAAVLEQIEGLAGS